MDWLTATILARHLHQTPDMNTDNRGLGVEYTINDKLSAVGGAYKNTLGRNSVYGGINYSPLQLGPFKFGATLGAVTGYEKAPVLPMIAPTASYEGENFGANLVFMPNPYNWKRSAIGLQLKARAKKDRGGLLDVSRSKSYDE